MHITFFKSSLTGNTVVTLKASFPCLILVNLRHTCCQVEWAQYMDLAWDHCLALSKNCLRWEMIWFHFVSFSFELCLRQHRFPVALNSEMFAEHMSVNTMLHF